MEIIYEEGKRNKEQTGGDDAADCIYNDSKNLLMTNTLLTGKKQTTHYYFQICYNGLPAVLYFKC